MLKSWDNKNYNNKEENPLFARGSHFPSENKEDSLCQLNLMENTQDYLQQEYCLEQQESRFCPAKMPRRFTHSVPAAVLRAKKCVMDVVNTAQENAEDIYADAKQINKDREQANEVYEDIPTETAEEEAAENTDKEGEQA